MPLIGDSPWRGLAKLVRDGGLGTRIWAVGVGIADENASGDQATWEGTPGSSLTLIFQTGTTGATPPLAADTVTIEIRLPDGTQIGTVDWTNPADGETRTFHFDDEPLNQVLNNPRAGMVEIYIRAVRGGVGPYDLDTRGTGAGGSDQWARGYLRSSVTLDSHSLSNASLGGAEPATFAYPDSTFLRATLDAVWYEAAAITGSLRQGGVEKGSIAGSSTTSVTRDFSFITAANKVDGDYAVGFIDLRLDMPSASFGGDQKYVLATSGHEAGWTRTSEDILDYDDRVSVDPTITVANLTIDSPWTVSTVHNRGGTVSGTLDRTNARSEAFSAQGSDTLRSIDVDTSADEEAADTVTPSGATLTWSITFNTSGNAATTDGVGNDKRWRYQDSGANVQPPLSAEPTYGKLDRSYSTTIHMQINNNTLNPALSVLERLNSDLGYYTVKLTNRRNEGINGASVTDHLRDDGDQVAQIDRTDTTATINGSSGYLPLKTWDSQLPKGGWDHWIDSGTHSGNSFSKARSGSGTFNYTLVVADPSLIMLVGGGNRDDVKDHFIPGADLICGFSVVNTVDHNGLAVDAGTIEITIGRINVALGRKEYLDPGDLTWKTMAGVVLAEPFTESTTPAIAASPGDSTLYILTIPAATTTSWTEYDVFLVVRTEISGVPISGFAQISLTGTSNPHRANQFDAVGLFK